LIPVNNTLKKIKENRDIYRVYENMQRVKKEKK